MNIRPHQIAEPRPISEILGTIPVPDMTEDEHRVEQEEKRQDAFSTQMQPLAVTPHLVLLEVSSYI